MLRIYPTHVIVTLAFCLTACGSVPKVDTARFSDLKAQIGRLPTGPTCEALPQTLFEITHPIDTSGGSFQSLADVGKQDAAAAAHLPIVQNQLRLIAQTAAKNEEVNAANRADYLQALSAIEAEIDKIIAGLKADETLTPFD